MTPLCSLLHMLLKDKYRSTSLSQSPREWRKYFELSEVWHKQNVTSPKHDVHVLFLQSKEEGKDQESIQSSTTPDLGYQWESDIHLQ